MKLAQIIEARYANDGIVIQMIRKLDDGVTTNDWKELSQDIPESMYKHHVEVTTRLLGKPTSDTYDWGEDYMWNFTYKNNQYQATVAHDNGTQSNEEHWFIWVSINE